MLASSPTRPPQRLHVLLIAVTLVAFHLHLSSFLSSLSSSISTNLGNGDDSSPSRGGDDARDLEGAEVSRLMGVSALLAIARLWSLCSAGVAGAGVYGLVKDRPPILRLFVLNSFLSLLLDLFLLVLILLLLTLSSSYSSSSSGLATTLCQALSSAPSAVSWSFRLPDLLGLSLEGCEERFEGVLVSALGTVAVVQGVRALAAVKVLSYYTSLTSPRRSGGRNALGLNVGSSSSGGRSRPSPLSMPSPSEERYRDSPVELSTPISYERKRRDSLRRERSVSGSGKHHAGRAPTEQTRILLLPRPDERREGREGEGDVPMLALTTPSPVRTSFPPQQLPPKGSSPSSKGNGLARTGSGKEGKVLVYAPVYMSPEEALSMGARDLVLHTSSSSNPSSSTPSSRYSRSSTSSTASSNHTTRPSRSGTIVPAAPPPSPSLAQGGGLRLDTAPLARGGPPRRQDSEGSDVTTPVATRIQVGQKGGGLMEALRGGEGDLTEEEFESKRV